MSNEYYQPSGTPGTRSFGASLSVRTEYNLVEAGFDKLPTLSGNGEKAVFINSAGTGLEAVTDAVAQSRLGLTIGTDVQAWSSILENTTASFTTAQETKLSYITVTGAVDLDAIINDVTFGVDHDDATGYHDKVTLEAGSAPSPSSTQATIYTKMYAGYPETFIKDGVSGVEIRLTNQGELNISITESSIEASVLEAVNQVAGLQFRGAPITLTVEDDGLLRVVNCDLSLGQNYFLSLTENVDEWRFINAPELRVPTIYVTINNTGAFTITDWNFTGDVFVSSAWGGATSLSPPASSRTAYGVALMPGPTLEIYPAALEAYSP